MQKQTLQTSARTVVGRKVKTLRKQGILPATLYGKSISSQTIQMDMGMFAKVFEKAGETGIIELQLDGKTYPTIVHTVQYHPITHASLHVDFFNVNLKEKITANIPLTLEGEAPAIKDKIGVLLTITSEIEVEALPTDLPDHIAVDVTTLTTIDQTIKVKGLKTPPSVKILADPEQDIVKVAPLVSKEAEQQMAQDAQAQTQAQTAAPEGEVKEIAPAETPAQKSPEEKS